MTRRRNGRLQACEPCRIAKHRCDHSMPVCSRCLVRGKPDSCVYHPAPMTRIREPSVSSPAKLQKILPDVRSTQNIEILEHVSPQSASSYKSVKTLFRRTYATTSFSAVFHENQAQIGADLLNVEDEVLGTESTGVDDPARVKLAIHTLNDFPTHRTCESLLSAFSTLHDVWISPKMIRHCLKSVWSTFGDSLKGSRSDQGLSSMAYSLFSNGENPPVPDEDQPWVNWFAGSALRWEMIGILFTFFGMTMMRLQDWDPIFQLPEQRGRSRKSASRRMRECADACLNLRNSDYPVNDVTVILWKNSGKLFSQVAGDESDEVSMCEGLLTTSFIEAGLHRLPARESGILNPQAEFRRILSGSGYYLEKSAALFKARPPAFTRFYCTFHIPLDLTEDQLYGPAKELNIAISKLDKDGWNTSGRISTISWVRALCMVAPIREEILEISVGVNMQAPPGRIDQLLQNLSNITSSYPPWIQYCNISQWSQPASSTENFYIVTRIQAEVLQTQFLLEKLKHSVSVKSRSQDLFNVAQDLMALTLSMWIDRDRFYDYQYAFHWLAVDYGIPAAGVLCVELLYTARHPHATDAVTMSKSDTIQSLILFVAFLDWVRVGDGNYELCRRLRKVIRNILDHVLEAEPVPLEKDSTLSSNYEDIEASHFDPSWQDLEEEDWLNMLNTMDWTQGFEMELSQ